ncbi:MAG: tetratricopeptide repeat protein [Myxococcota bacterium]
MSRSRTPPVATQPLPHGRNAPEQNGQWRLLRWLTLDGRETSPPSQTDVGETMADEHNELEPQVGIFERGDTLDRYVVLERLGAGSMGLVYAAYDPKLDRRVALKLLHARGGPEQGTRRAQRLAREAQAMARLNHPNVVTVHDVGTADDRVFVAMEHVDGQTLTKWLASTRSWREVIEVFLAAGRGLEAAHQQGLVHRDFKPDNVMLGSDGRVRVMDFGLARADDDGSLDDDEDSARYRSVDVDLASHLTRTGAVMGTPAYMAPEQHMGQAVDARSDQFAFCVALYEGLYGSRPFRGDTVAALGLAAMEGHIEDPPPGRSVPKWLRRVVVQGLAAAPDERFGDMKQLLHGLEVDPRRRRRIVLGATAGVVLIGASGWATARASRSGVAPCTGAQQHVADVWDEDRSERVAAALRATGSAVAEDTVARVGDRLDRYTEDWVAMRTDSCRATRIDGEQSEALLDLRTACLDDRLRRVDQVVDILEHADQGVVQRAVGAVAGLPSLEPCADATALRSRLPPPDDADTAAEVERLRGTLGHAQALLASGRDERARKLVDDALERAEALAYPPLLAEAQALSGELSSHAGNHEEAAATLSQAYFTALRVHHDDVAAAAAASLTYVVGYRLARPAEGRQWGEHALAMGLRVGEGQLEEARARHNLGVLANSAGDNDAASTHYERAFALRTALLPADHPDLARSLNALGNVHLRRGEYDHALGRYQEALALRERVYGPNHPAVAGVHNNISLVRRRRGDYAGACESLGQAVEIYERALGSKHPHLAQAVDNLGIALREGGDPVAAEAQYRRALEIRRQALGPEHPDLADSWMGLGRALSDQGRHDEAEPLQRRALALFERSFGPEHLAVGSALVGLGIVQMARGDDAAAVPNLQRAATIIEAAMPGSSESVEARTLLKQAHSRSASP